MTLSLIPLCMPVFAADAVPPEASEIMENHPQVSEENFSGYWFWASGDERFSLNLTQNDDQLTGFHSSTRYGSGKEDSVMSTQTPSINGQVRGSGSVVRFRSGFPGSEAYGHARLTLRGRYLYWQLMDATGEHYLPENAVLIRQKQ